MNPGCVLTSGSGFAAGKEPKRHRHLRKRAVIFCEDNAASQEHQPRHIRGGGGFCFPLAAYPGEKVVAWWRALRDGFVSAVRSVDPDRRAADHDSRYRPALRNGSDDGSCGADAAVEKSCLARRRPTPVADSLAGEVDHRLGAIDGGMPVVAVRIRIPSHVVRLARPPRQHQDAVPFRAPAAREDRSQESAAASDDDRHPAILTPA